MRGGTRLDGVTSCDLSIMTWTVAEVSFKQIGTGLGFLLCDSVTKVTYIVLMYISALLNWQKETFLCYSALSFLIACQYTQISKMLAYIKDLLSGTYFARVAFVNWYSRCRPHEVSLYKNVIFFSCFSVYQYTNLVSLSDECLMML